MSRLFSELTKEAEAQQKALQQQQDQPTPDTDTETSVTDVGVRRLHQALDTDKLKIIIRELSEIKVATYGTPVRLSEAERRDIEDFVYITLRKSGVEGKTISSAKLMRFALRYLMKVHEAEFVQALAEALKKEEQLSI